MVSYRTATGERTLLTTKMQKILFCAFVCLSALSVDCKTYEFTGYEWKGEIRKCASGGEDWHNYLFAIGTFDGVGLKYDSINQSSKVIAYGDLKGHTGAVDNNIPSLPLVTYQDHGDSKKFFGEWGYEATAGWAKQRVRIQLTVKFMKTGKVELNNYVYAASWGAVTCAETTSYVNKVEIIAD